MPAEVENDAYVPNYNDTDYSDFLFLAPPMSAEFLPLESQSTDKAAALGVKKATMRPAETRNTGTTPPPVTPADLETGYEEEEYFRATFPAVSEKKVSQTHAGGVPTLAERQAQRRPSFVEVTPVKVHHDPHDKTAAAAKEAQKHKRHSHSSHSSEPMNWWPENETTAQHVWTGEGGDEEGDVVEEEVWSDAFYE